MPGRSGRRPRGSVTAPARAGKHERPAPSRPSGGQLQLWVEAVDAEDAQDGVVQAVLAVD